MFMPRVFRSKVDGTTVVQFDRAPGSIPRRFAVVWSGRQAWLLNLRPGDSFFSEEPLRNHPDLDFVELSEPCELPHYEEGL
jgi:hypothetical protein